MILSSKEMQTNIQSEKAKSTELYTLLITYFDGTIDIQSHTKRIISKHLA